MERTRSHSARTLSVTILALAGPLPLTRADLVTLHPVADTTIYESASGNLANGAGTAMFAGRNSGMVNSKRRALVRFDFSSIPQNAILTSATLRLNNSAANADPATVSLYRVDQSWGEGASIASGGQGGGIAAATGDATWLYRTFADMLWTSPGGDFAAAPSAAITVTGAGSYEWSSVGLLNDVSGFHLNSSTNFGWILIGDETVASSAKRFATREEPTADLQPTLTVAFQVPEPAGAAIFVLAASVLSNRRRDRAGGRPRPGRREFHDEKQEFH